NEVLKSEDISEKLGSLIEILEKASSSEGKLLDINFFTMLLDDIKDSEEELPETESENNDHPIAEEDSNETVSDYNEEVDGIITETELKTEEIIHNIEKDAIQPSDDTV